MNKLIVKHVATRSPYGREQRPVRVFNPMTKQMEEVGSSSGKRKPNKVFETLRFAPDRSQGKFITGLEESVTNPFIDMEPLDIRGKYALNEKWTDVVLDKVASNKNISKQQYFEILDGVDPGYYTPAMAHSLRNSPLPIRTDGNAKDQTFIEKFEIILYEGANIFQDGTSRGRMAIQLLMNSPLVAGSQRETNKDVHHWYVAEEQEEEKTRTEMDDLENRSILALVELFTKHPIERAYQLGVGMNIFSGQLNPIAIKDQLNRYVKAKMPNHQRAQKVQRLEKFMEMYEMLTSNFPLFISTYMASQAMRNGILYNDSGKVYWKSKQNTPEAHAWRNRQSLVLALMESMGQYDPDREVNDNLFGDMVEELNLKGISVNID